MQPWVEWEISSKNIKRKIISTLNIWTILFTHYMLKLIEYINLKKVLYNHFIHYLINTKINSILFLTWDVDIFQMHSLICMH